MTTLTVKDLPEVKAAIQSAYDEGFRDGQANERARVKNETLDAIGHYVDIDERTDLAEAEFVKPIK